jgi:hypothetical protein
MSALLPKTDMDGYSPNVRLVPNPDIARFHPITLSAKLDSHLCVLRYHVCAFLREPRSDN